MYNVTLIIPTHNRHDYLSRSMEYFKDLSATVIYCDSSEVLYNGDISSNIKYLHLPGLNFAAKILEALKKVDTQFIALCADDDFIMIESLCEGVEFLEENTEYKTLVGVYTSFLEKFDGKFFKMYQELPDSLSYTPEKNAKLFFENYYQILWALYDLKLIENAFKIIAKASFKNDNFIEIVIGANATFYGGIKFMDSIWGIRELNEKDHWGARHEPISNILAEDVNGDFYKFKYLLDEQTKVGFADLVIDSYLSPKSDIKVKLKNLIRSIIPKSIFVLLKKNQNSRLTSLRLMDFSQTQQIRMDKIGSILSRYL